ncbi:MAG: 3-methyl-2-oxobutanoate hydroxymethyltransferase [Candidatus Syntrophonatronum acetioxidans]|uniref:3-methyl-2-oxobutanoate hydroxymethyltransferase n=1 Tax=Candidatus Syntrophonatronum acetioxidans TaxID=1795816 RepID=A0A424YHH3_9FIRM|nr:MAG: 3-methyl-2-oxobutanoate hydroxymethyltransferase [Candidatus Syntrophonatronum acetioxidans]
MNKKVTTAELREKKQKGEKISMVTAYDYSQAKIVDEAGIDIILVGDSLGNVVLGYESTLSVTMEEMIHHGKAAVRGSRRAMVVVDMPFLSYQVNRDEAIKNAGRLIKETGAHAVKVEGGEEILEAVKGITSAGIPVMGHLGLTPQSIGQLGGFKVQGKDVQVAKKMIRDARALEDAGAFSVVLECVPWQLASFIRGQVSMPVIGIGAGRECDGQVLVFHDVMGLFDEYRPKFVKQYQNMKDKMIEGIKEYIDEVREGKFPGEEHIFTMEEEAAKQLE